MFAGSGVRFHTAVSCINTVLIVVVTCVIFIHGFFRSSDVVGTGSEYFVVYLSCVYIVRLIMSSYLFFCTRYLLQCSAYHMLSKMRSSGIYIPGTMYRVIGEVLVLGLLVEKRQL